MAICSCFLSVFIKRPLRTCSSARPALMAGVMRCEQMKLEKASPAVMS